MGAFEEAIDNAAEHLPGGWQILLSIENSGGCVELFDPHGDPIEYPSNCESMADSVNDAVAFAMEVQHD
jgi:hypothetical protein